MNVKKDNDYGEFQPIQSGGIVKNFDNENLLLTTGNLDIEIMRKTIHQFWKILLIQILEIIK